MKRIIIMLALALGATTLNAQAAELPTDGEVGDQIRLILKTDDVFEGEVSSIDKDGVKIDIGDGTELFIRWSFTRGGDHLALRKRCVDNENLDSLLALADFCHEFALDDDEARTLYDAIKLDPENGDLIDRYQALPTPEELKNKPLPGRESEPEIEPETEPDTEPESEPETPEPKIGSYPELFVDITTDDDESKTWLDEEFEKAGYRIGKKTRHKVRVEVEITFTLTANPDFFGSELYAMYDGKVIVKLYEKDSKTAFHSYDYVEKDLKRDTRVVAKNDMRSALLTEALRDTHSQLSRRAKAKDE